MIELNPDKYTQLERISTLTLLGIRFWDPATDVPVSDGLVVTARADKTSGPTVTACRTASGVYAFQGLPNLREIEYPVKEPAQRTTPTGTHRFIIEAKDEMHRFLPIAFAVDLPLPYQGIYRPSASTSPPELISSRFYLFSAPTRTASPGMATVRAHVLEHTTEHPAAHTMLEVRIKGKKWYGLADEQGRVAIHFPYPTFIGGLGDSPPKAPLSQQQWPLTVHVLHSPIAADLTGTAIPNLRRICAQPPGTIWVTETGPRVTERSFNLVFGQELVIRTTGQSTLLIDPGGSPI